MSIASPSALVVSHQIILRTTGQVGGRSSFDHWDQGRRPIEYVLPRHLIDELTNEAFWVPIGDISCQRGDTETDTGSIETKSPQQTMASAEQRPSSGRVAKAQRRTQPQSR